MDLYLKNALNESQLEAVSNVKGPLLILAGAGSGKTRTITYRIYHMIKNLAIAPQSILGITFTNKAAREMRERTFQLIGQRNALGPTLSTFHALGVRILQQEIEHLGFHRNFSIYATGEQMAIIRQALKNFKANKSFDIGQVLSKISFCKNNDIGENEFAQSKHFDHQDPDDLATEYVYRFYQDKLRFYNAIDFDEILYLTARLFKQKPLLAKKWSERFQYIMIDEYQDTNALQFQLALALTSTHHNICVVGDDDQSIYGFRGADINNILDFEKHFRQAKIIKLEENYRSTMPILDLANKVIEKNKKRKKKTLWTKLLSKEQPFLWSMADPDHEAQIVVEEINDQLKKGQRPKDFAILYRSNHQAPPFEDQLRLQQIPYTVFGGQKFYDKKEIRDLIGHLLLILNLRDENALRRILNVPNRGIGSATLGKYLNKMKEEKLSLFATLEKYPGLDPQRKNNIGHFVELIRRYQQKFSTQDLSSTISALIQDIDYLKFIEKQYDSNKQIDLRKKDVQHFIESAARFQRYNENTSLRSFVEKLLLQDSQDRDGQEDEQESNKDQVTMMTLHSSKGLEFDNIYLVGVEDQILPHKKTVDHGEDISEERRLLYVGITRARKRLVMTYCKQREQYGKEIKCLSSRFLRDLDGNDLFVEQDRTTFGHLTPEETEKYKKDFFAGLIGNL